MLPTRITRASSRRSWRPIWPGVFPSSIAGGPACGKGSPGCTRVRSCSSTSEDAPMAEVTRHIGLSLGADLCWPLCFEHMMKRLDLKIPFEGDTLRFEVERVTIEPFDLRQPCKYDLVVDRLTHWYQTSREWVKKPIGMNDLYVF